MSTPIDDPGSLSRLHDIVVLPPVSWWPPAPAWYFVGGAMLICISLATVWGILHWRANWYRRAGLAELLQIEQAQVHDQRVLIQLAELLKRVALVAYPRQEVAALTGTAWLVFLDQSAGTTQFSDGPGRQLLDVYNPEPSLPSPELLNLAMVWIQRHRRNARC